MLKLLPPQIETFHNVKCGEIFCTTAAVFSVTCCLCGSTMYMDQFVGHYEVQHLTLAEETINLEPVEEKCPVNLANDMDFGEYEIIKATGVDPIDGEQDYEGSVEGISHVKVKSPSTSDREEDEDNKCLLDWFHAKKAKQKTHNVRKNTANKLSRRKDKDTRFIDYDEINMDPIQEDKPDEELETVIKNDPNSQDFETSDKDFKTITEMQWSSDEEDAEQNIEHAEKPEEVLPFPCHICNRAYRNKKCLRRHIYNIHNPKNIEKNAKKSKPKHKCEECGEVFSSARNLSGHKWKHTGIYCDICGKQFTQVGNMIRHKIRHTGIKEFKCKECTKDFFTAKELRLHMLCHSKVMPVICEICGKGCRDRGVLTAHMRRHTGERPAKCDKCGKCFFSIHDLNIHAVAHTDARPFKCDICGSTFQRRKALRIHKLIHSNNRKHLCRICGKGFALSSGLNSHLRTHDTADEISVIRNSETSFVNNNPAISFPSSGAEPATSQIDLNLNQNIGKELQQHMEEFMI